MNLRASLILIVAAAVVGGSCFSVGAQATRSLDTRIDGHGSIPPVFQWFSCFRALRDKPFDRRGSQTCLESILSHSQIQKGEFIFKRGKDADVLTFRLQSPSLTVMDVDMDVPAEQLDKIHGLVSGYPGALRVGGPYDESGEGDIALALDVLLRSTRRRATVSRTTYLDYRQKTARIAFKIWDGPSGEPEQVPQSCEIIAGNFNLTDVDDLSPVDFVERQLKTKWLGCYSDADVQYDANQLKQMTFLKDASISADGTGDIRTITVRLQGNPIPIAEVTVRGYGLLNDLRESELPPITIKPGDIYRCSTAAAIQQLLIRTFSVRERRAKVYSDVRVNESGKAELNFSVLAYPDDIVYVDGERFDNSVPDH